MTDRRKDGRIIALVNNKGGVAKTTAAVALAVALYRSFAYTELAR